MTKCKLTFFGKGGHGAEPHKAIDTTVIASEFIRKISKNNDVDIISFSSGNAFNVISGVATITLETTNITKIEKVSSAILLYYGEETKYTIDEI